MAAFRTFHSHVVYATCLTEHARPKCMKWVCLACKSSRRSDPCQSHCTSILGWSSSSPGGPDKECLQPGKWQSRRSCDQSSRKRDYTEEANEWTSDFHQELKRALNGDGSRMLTNEISFKIWDSFRDLYSDDLPWTPLWCGRVRRLVSPCFLQRGRWRSPVPSAPRRRWSWSQPHCGEETQRSWDWSRDWAKLQLTPGWTQCGCRYGAREVQCYWISSKMGESEQVGLTPSASFPPCLRCNLVLLVRRACRIPECRRAGPGSWMPVPEQPCSTE